MKLKSIYLFITLFLACLFTMPLASSNFEDARGHWAENHIAESQKRGWIHGFEDGTFRPDNNITRREIAAFISGMNLQKQRETVKFSDVAEGTWYATHVQNAYVSGLINGYEDGMFRPESNATRAEAVKIISTAMGLEDVGEVNFTFVDIHEIPEWIKADLANLVKKGMMHGFGDNTIRMGNQITRAEWVKMWIDVYSRIDNTTIEQNIRTALGIPEPGATPTPIPTVAPTPTSSGGGGGGSSSGGNTPAHTPTPVSNIAHLTSLELTHTMGAGWNLGNTLDAHFGARGPHFSINTPSQQETAWGNPVTTKEMIDFLKAEGFNTVRVPVTWYIFTGSGPEYNIDERWMNRVQEVVDYVIDNGMFCIINIHHDDYRFERNAHGIEWEIGWLRPYHTDGTIGSQRPLTIEEKNAQNLRLRRIWEQISERFKDYDEYLLFEGMNEPHVHGYVEPFTREFWDEVGDALNELNQTFVNTVRASGGNNYNRHLLVAPYFANVGMSVADVDGRINAFIDRENAKLRIHDPRADNGKDTRLIASIHYYEPWAFTSAPTGSQWHVFYYDLNASGVSWNLNILFDIVWNNFVSLGIPVIMGETGAVHRQMPNGESNDPERVKWALHYVGGLKQMGVPSIYWDHGHGGRYFAIMDRHAVTWFHPTVAEALLEASRRPITLERPPRL
jgi:endoglucanase